MNIEIFKAKCDQLDQVRDIIETTFLESFAHLNTVENIDLYSAKAFTKEQILKEFKTQGSFFFFVYQDGDLAGYLKLNVEQAQTESVLENALEIERIYIFKAFQNQKIGQTLFDFSVQFAKERQSDWLWLGVWDQNDKAIEFYTRQGLCEFSQHGFKLGHEQQTDILMKLAI